MPVQVGRAQILARQQAQVHRLALLQPPVCQSIEMNQHGRMCLKAPKPAGMTPCPTCTLPNQRSWAH